MATASGIRKDFWNSKRAQEFVHRLMGQFEDWHVAEDVEPWEALRDDVFKHNTRGRYLVDPRPGVRIVLMDAPLPERDDGVVSYDDINEAIWSRDPNYQPVRGRSSGRLRTLKKTTEQQLRKKFGKLPTGRWWVLTVKRQGLKLNRKAVTWELHEPIKKTRERPFSQFSRLDDLR